MMRIRAPQIAAALLLLWSLPSQAAETGTVVVRLVSEPQLAAGNFGFTGHPAGTIRLEQGIDVLTETDLEAGPYSTTLAQFDPAVVGYELVSVECDAPGSSGNITQRRANFTIEPGRTVTCTFRLAAQLACICPQEGRWTGRNLPGQMVCTGAMNMTMPLKPSQAKGMLEVKDGCDTLVGTGLSEDEATLVMHRTDNCGYRGTVGGSQDGIPMTIEFNWTVENDRRITGNLHSTVSHQGMTCNMSRNYELDFDQ